MEDTDPSKPVIVRLDITFVNGEVLRVLVDENMRVCGISLYLRDYVMERKEDIVNIVFSNGLKLISGWLFHECTSLTSVTLPETVTEIQFGSFKGCTSLASITIPSCVKIIEKSVFQDCSSLVSVILPRGLMTIEELAFYGCSSLSSLTVPDSVTTIGKYVFSDCISLSAITLPKGITVIETRTFFGCKSLVTVIVPKNVKQINWGAFGMCLSLVSVVLPPSCTLCEKSFFGCRLLSMVVTSEITFTDPSPVGEFFRREKLRLIFRRCRMLTPPKYVTPHTPSAIAMARGLEYWTPMTHHLCRTHIRKQVAHMILVLYRLELPILVILKILKMLKRHEVGTHLSNILSIKS